MSDDEIFRFMYRDASNTVSALDQRLAAYRDLIRAWELVALVLMENPTHVKRCTAKNDGQRSLCPRCESLDMFQEVKKITDAIVG